MSSHPHNLINLPPVMLVAALLWLASRHTKDGQPFSSQPKWVIALEVMLFTLFAAGYAYALINHMAFCLTGEALARTSLVESVA